MELNERGAIVPPSSMGSAVACARSLGRRGIDVVGVGHSRSDPLLHSKYCTESHVVPDPSYDLEGYVDSLSVLATRDDIRTMLPLREKDIYVLTRYQERFQDRLELPLVPFERFQQISDRLKLINRARDLVVPVPETTLLDEWGGEGAALIKSRYSILESDDGLTYPGVRFVAPEEELDVDEVIADMGHVPIVQEFVPSDGEFGFFGLLKDGDLRARFQHQRLRSTNYFGGASTHRKSVEIGELEDLGMKLLNDLEWNGPAMVEFRRDRRTGEFRLMEINPRFWGSLPLAIHSGVDFPDLYHQLATSGDCEKVLDYRLGVKSTLLRGDVQHLTSTLTARPPPFMDRPSFLRSTAGVLKSLRGSKFDVLSRDDPAPFGWMIIDSFNRLLGRHRS